MNRTNTPFTLFLLTGILLALCGTAQAQLNEKKITRDATGIYKGKISGGSMTYIPVEGESSTFPGPDSFGKTKVPIKKGKSTVGVRDNDIQGDGSALGTGKAKDPDVSRNGKKIKYTARGSVDNPAGETSLEGGAVKGTFKSRGSKWIASLKGSAQQIFDSGEQYLYTGRKLLGKS